MAKIQIKRGLQSAVSNLVLSEGELAVALDTGNVYVGATAGNIHINPSTASEAVKLQTARMFSIIGDGTASGMSFDGTSDVALNFVLNTIQGLTAGTYSKVTINNKGLVTGTGTLEVADIPSLPVDKITGLGDVATKNSGTSVGNVVVVESDGKINSSLLPSIAITNTFVVANEAEMLALTAQIGDIAVRSDINKSYILKTDGSSILANWQELLTPTGSVLSVNGKTGAVILTASDVGATPASHANSTDGHPVATTSLSGFMSNTDKTKLDGIETGANNYTLPTASTSVKGGVIVGSGLTISNDTLSLGDIDGGTF